MPTTETKHISPEITKSHNLPAWAFPAVVFGCAFILRLAVLFQFKELNPLFDHPVVDAWRYDSLAKDFLRFGSWPEPGAFFQPPVYPFFLAAIYSFLGESYTLVRVIQACLGSLSCVFVFLLGARLYTRPIGFTAGLVTAFYGPLIFFDLDLLAPVLIIFWSMLGLNLLHCGLEKAHKGLLLAAGICLGIALVTWPIIGLFCGCVCVLIGWRFRHYPRLALSLVMAVGIGVALPILPVFLHNVMHDEWVLVSTNGGINFFIGNNPDWQQTVAIRPGYPWEKIVTLPYHLDGAEQADKIGSSSIFFREALNYIIFHPLDYAENQLTKLYQLVFGYEIMRNTDLYFFKQYSSLLDKLIFSNAWLKFPFGLLFPFGALGIWTSLRRSDGENKYLIAYLGAGSLGLFLFFVTARYRVILVPVLAIYAAVGFRNTVAALLEKKRYAPLLPAFLLGLFALANFDLINPQRSFKGPVYQAQAPFTLGRVNLENNKPQQALGWLEQSVKIDPRYPDAWVDIGRAHYALGRNRAAIEAMNQAIAVAPDYPLPYFNLALIYDQPSLPKDEAIHYYKLFITKSDAYFDDRIRGTKRLELAQKRIAQLETQPGNE